jgi:N-methylhydantoinase B
MLNDKVLLEVLNNHFTGIVEEMGYVIHRAGFTVFVKETWDFDSALVAPSGEIFCYPRNIGVTNMLGMHMGAAIAAVPDLAPGDVIVTNDPKTTAGMCTHLPDIMLFKPLFHEGRLLCFAWCFVHSSDVGGLVPGSIAPTAYDRFQEGFAIPPTRLYRKGVLNEELLRIILHNCRIPEQNWGDMKALLSALTVAERRITDLARRHGGETITGVMGFAETRARAILSKIPDGTYAFSDYVEVDYVTPYHVRIKVALTATAGAIHLDFTGTDPEVRAAMNLPTFGRPNQWIVLGIVNYLRTSDRTLPLNRGLLRSVTATIPEGTVLNPGPVAASGIRHVTGYRVADAVLGALSQAVPGAIPAAGAGQVAIVLFSYRDSGSGTYRVSVLQPMQGGSGARPIKDGIDGVNFSAGSLRNVPTESIENEAPVLVHQYCLADSAAAGKYRGGTGVIFEFECLAPEALVTARGMDRFRLRPYGREGGEAGTLGDVVLAPAQEEARRTGKIDVLRLQPHDVVRITAPGGGGYGNPAGRAPEAVLRDVADGFVTEKEARETYRVAIVEGKLDVAATSTLRAVPAAQDAPPFLFGPERAEYEAVLPPALQDLVSSLLAARPGPVRQFARDRLYAALERNPALRAKPPSLLAAEMSRLLDDLLAA